MMYIALMGALYLTMKFIGILFRVVYYLLIGWWLER